MREAKEVLEDEFHFDACPTCGSWELEEADDLLWCNGCGRWVNEEGMDECNRSEGS